MKLRKKIPVSYYEPDEPSFDEYIYCEKCADFVFEYCSIHGPLLVIPDDKVPLKTGLPPFVPRAALTIPHSFLHLAPSVIPGAGLGVFSSLTLPRGVRFGPYGGTRATEPDSMYCWEIRDSNNKWSHAIDASDANASNWMRYVNCARRWPEQNLIAYQYQGQIYYRTIKIIPRFTELLVFYGSEFATVLDIDIRRFNYDITDLKPIGKITKKHAVEYDHSINNIVKLPIDGKMKQRNVDNINPCLPYEEFGTITEEFIIIDEFEQNYYGEENIEQEGNIAVEYDLEIGSKLTDPNTMSEVMENHPSKASKNPLYVCSNCKNSFARNSGLRRHQRVCNQNKVYKCYTCGYTNSSMHYLARHYLSHPGPHQCHICNKTFALRNSFTSHMKRHNANKLYNCSKCYFKTNYLYLLSQHLTVHMQEKTYQCDMCSYSTFVRNNFVKHIKTHYK